MALEIKSGSTTDVADVTTKKALEVTPIERAYDGGVGGGFTIAAAPAAVVAAAAAANSTLFSARYAAAAARKAYIEEVVIEIAVGAAFTAPGGVLNLVKFSAAAPAGGTALTAVRKNATEGGLSDMTDIRVNNAALTVAGVTFDTNPVGVVVIGQGGAGAAYDARIPFDGSQNAPLVLLPGEGLALRTYGAAFGLGGTWLFGLRMSWHER